MQLLLFFAVVEEDINKRKTEKRRTDPMMIFAFTSPRLGDV
jgi:hypothetical protein